MVGRMGLAVDKSTAAKLGSTYAARRLSGVLPCKRPLPVAAALPQEMVRALARALAAKLEPADLASR